MNGYSSHILESVIADTSQGAIVLSSRSGGGLSAFLGFHLTRIQLLSKAASNSVANFAQNFWRTPFLILTILDVKDRARARAAFEQGCVRYRKNSWWPLWGIEDSANKGSELCETLAFQIIAFFSNIVLCWHFSTLSKLNVVIFNPVRHPEHFAVIWSALKHPGAPRSTLEHPGAHWSTLKLSLLCPKWVVRVKLLIIMYSRA